MYVCLMRHGKAEAAADGMADADRRLNEKGIQQVMAMANLAKKLWPLGTTAVWASPLLRARETAVTMSRAIRAEKLSSHEAIASGDIQAVYTDILAQEKSDVVLLVGHEPYLSRWLKQWTGLSLDFKAGSMVLLDYDSTAGTVGQGSMILFVRPDGADLILRRV
jgi:phosphohistidine phosphatase